METQGLEMRAQKLRIGGSSLTSLAPSSIIIDAAISVDIFTSTFGESDAEAMRISSKSINVFNNTFYSIPITWTNKGVGGKISVTNNVLHNFALNANVLGFLQAEFIRNSLFCSCPFAQELEKAKALVADFFPNFDSILSNNFCQSNCSKQLSIKDYLQQAKKACMTGEVDLCGADATPNTPSMSGRSGRKEDHEEQHGEDATTEGMTAGSARFEATSLLLATFLVTLFILT